MKSAGQDSRILFVFTLGVCLLLLGQPLAAQEFRGEITGRVTDPHGAIVPGARVVVTKTDTNVSTRTATNQAGEYTALYLIPGLYNVSVEAKGFKKLSRQGIEVRVADKLTLDLQLQVGSTQEEVTVTAEAPLLETTSASSGQVIDGRRISELPLSDGNPFTLERLAPGVTYTATGTNVQFSRPFDNGGTSSIRVDGVSGGNEFTFDGSPNMANGNRVAFIPPADAVQEFKLETAHFDAQHAHTAGANVNVAVKSGTNQLHGTLYEFVRNDVLNANDFFANRSRAGKSATRYNRYGGSVGGPVWIPKLYNGRDKTFFFFAYEALPDVFPEPRQFTVPTDAERRGDFSALLGQGITIYDPATGQPASGGRVQRRAISCNGQTNVICPERLSPIAQNYLKFYPQPNLPGDRVGKNNYFSNQPRSDRFNSETVRIDQNLSQKQKAFFTFRRNWRREFRGNWTGQQNGIFPTGNYLFRINDGGTYDHTYTFSSTTLLDARVGFSRFVEQNAKPSVGHFDPASLGFSPQTVAFFRGAHYLPRFNIGGGSLSSSGFSALGDNFGSFISFNIYSFQPTLTKILGVHTLRLGYDFRAYRENQNDPGNIAGSYDFGTSFTKGQLDNASGAAIGQDLAAFLLGQPTGGAIDRNAGRANQTLYNGLFFQDDWKVSSRLSLNLGLRYDVEGGTTERHNRMIRGFDATDPSPIETAAKGAYASLYAAKPSNFPFPPDSFHVRGGLLFATAQHRGYWNADTRNFQPRLGAAYQLNQKTVLRGGWGIFVIPFIISQRQTGFSQATNIVPTANNGLTFQANLFNPFPGGVSDPPGASLGLATFIGRDITFEPLDRRNGRAQRWTLGIQRRLPREWLIEVAYVGNRGYGMVEDTNVMDAIPRQFLSTSPVRGTCASSNSPSGCTDDPAHLLLSQSFTNFNPFKELAPDTNLNGSNVSWEQLLRPFPQFTKITTQRNDGTSIYHSAQLRAEKRFAHGYTLLASYTWSKLLEKVSFLNDSDTKYEKRVSGQDVPHSFTISGIWEFPFGQGRRWGTAWRGVTNQVLGGWQAQGIYQVQSGFPLSMGNRAYFGDPSKLRSHISSKTVDNAFLTNGFYFTDAPVQKNGVVDPGLQRNDQRINLTDNVRTFPSFIPNFRGSGINNWDLSVIKRFSISERANLQFRAEFLNAFNHPKFGDPNLDPRNSDFGRIKQQDNLPRNIQLGLKLTF